MPAATRFLKEWSKHDLDSSYMNIELEVGQELFGSADRFRWWKSLLFYKSVIVYSYIFESAHAIIMLELEVWRNQ